MNRIVPIALVLVVFSLWSTTVVLDQGYFGFLTLARDEPWGRQVLLDLCIALTLAWMGLSREARRLAIPRWPYLLLTLTLGSIGPLCFLVHRWLRLRGGEAAPAPSSAQ